MGLEAELVYREQPISRLRFSKPLVSSLGDSWFGPQVCACATFEVMKNDPDITPSFTNNSKGTNGECGGAYMASLNLEKFCNSGWADWRSLGLRRSQCARWPSL